MNPALIEQIRSAVMEGRHRFSQHALAELHVDNLHAVDAESALLSGTLTGVQDQSDLDVPGPRYTVVGTATDLATQVGVVCRFEPPEQLLIVTCYEMK